MAITGRLGLVAVVALAACSGAAQVPGSSAAAPAAIAPAAIAPAALTPTEVEPEATASQSGTILQSPSLGPAVDPGGLPPGALGDPTAPAAAGPGMFYGPGGRNFYGYN